MKYYLCFKMSIFINKPLAPQGVNSVEETRFARQLFVLIRILEKERGILPQAATTPPKNSGQTQNE